MMSILLPSKLPPGPETPTVLDLPSADPLSDNAGSDLACARSDSGLERRQLATCSGHRELPPARSAPAWWSSMVDPFRLSGLLYPQRWTMAATSRVCGGARPDAICRRRGK